MLFNLPLKQTKPVDFSKAIQQYIINNYGEQTLYDQCKQAIEKTDKLRKSLDYDRINLSIANDPQTSQDLENNLLEYIRYLTLICKYVRFELHETKPAQVVFLWGDSYDAKRQGQLNSARYELACQYYNFMVTSYYIASSKVQKETDTDRKQAITKLRNGLWALEQLKPLLVVLPKEVKDQHYDLSAHNIEFLERAFIGLCYKCLYLNMASQVKTFGVQSVAGTLFEASKEFSLSLHMAQEMNQSYQKQIGKALLQQMVNGAQFNYVWSVVQSCIQMANYHYSRIADESRGQNMGKALGFLQKAQQSLEPITSDKNAAKVFSSVQMDKFKELQASVGQMLGEYSMKNQQIYKEQIVQNDVLPIPPVMDQLRIKPLAPAPFAEMLADSQQFSGFISEEGLQLAREIKIFIDQQRYQLDEAYKQLHDQKNKAYAENYVNYFIDMFQAAQNSQTTAQIPQNTKEKIDYIRRRGGVAGVDQIVKQQKQLSVECAQLLGSVEQTIQTERAEDDQCRQKYGQQWQRTPSNTLNGQYISSVAELKGKLLQAQSIDFEVMSAYQLFQQYAGLAAQPDNVIAQQLPKTENNDDFVTANSGIFKQLADADMATAQSCDEMKKIIYQFMECINNTNFTKLAVQGINSGTTKEEIQQQAYATIAQFIEQFNNQMNIVSTLVSQVCAHTTELQKLKRSTKSSLPAQDQTLSGFQDASSFLDNLDHSLIFYQQLQTHLGELDRKVKDYAMARAMEKEDKAQQLGQKPQIAQPAQPQPPKQLDQAYAYPNAPQYPQQYPQQQQYPGQQGQQYPPQYPQQYAQQQQPPNNYPQYPQQGYPPQGYPGQQGYPQGYPQQGYPPQQGGQWGTQNQNQNKK